MVAPDRALQAPSAAPETGACFPDVMQIREYRTEDAEAVERCYVELQDHERRMEPLRAEGRAVVKKYLAHLFSLFEEKRGKIFVADEGGSVVGFVCVFARATGDALINVQSEFAYVSDLVVLADYRGRGVGLALLREAEAFAVREGATLLKLSVMAKNTPARELYRRNGFDDFEVSMLKVLGARP